MKINGERTENGIIKLTKYKDDYQFLICIKYGEELVIFKLITKDLHNYDLFSFSSIEQKEKIICSADVYQKVEGNVLSIDFTLKTNIDYLDEIEIEEDFDLTNLKEYFFETIDNNINQDLLYLILKDYVNRGEVYGHNPLIIKHSKDIFNITEIMKETLKGFDFGDISPLDGNDYLQIIKDFFNLYEINIDIDGLINRNIIEFIDNYGENNSTNGKCISNIEQNEFHIYVRKSNDISEMIVLLHELIHYYVDLNHTNNEDLKEIFAEFLPYTYELVFINYLIENNIYRSFAIEYLNRLIYIMHISISDSYPLVLSLKEHDDVDRVLFELDKDKYNDWMLYIIHHSSSTYSFILTIIGYYFTLYYFNRYITVEDKINDLKELTKVVMTEEEEDILSFLNISNEEKNVENISNTIEYFKGVK